MSLRLLEIIQIHRLCHRYWFYQQCLSHHWQQYVQCHCSHYCPYHHPHTPIHKSVCHHVHHKTNVTNELTGHFVSYKSWKPTGYTVDIGFISHITQHRPQHCCSHHHPYHHPQTPILLESQVYLSLHHKTKVTNQFTCHFLSYKS